MIIFSKIKSADLSKLSDNQYQLFFKDINKSEIAFLCFMNKSFPRKFCPAKWTFSFKDTNKIYYNSIESLQYKLFLMLHDYKTISTFFLLGLANGMKFLLQKQTKKETSKYIKSLKIGKEKVRIDLNDSTISKNDVKKIIKMFNDIQENEKKFSWSKIENLEFFGDIEAELFNEKYLKIKN